MNNKPYVLLFILLLSYILPANSQQIPIGQWRDELPYNEVISVTEAKKIIYAATPYAVFTVDLDDNSISRLTKINGLSDIGITCIQYNTNTETVIVTYTNANIDLLHNNLVTNISDIKRKQILGNKTINSIYCYENFAYLACGFGIVVVDLEKEEIKDTYYIGEDGSPVNVLSITCDDQDSIFAATEKGIYKAWIKDQNLVNFASWKIDNRIDPTMKYNTIATVGEKTYVNKSRTTPDRDTIYVFYNGTWNPWLTDVSNTILKLESRYDQLIISYNYFVRVYNANGDLIRNVWSYYQANPRPLDAILSSNQWVWIGDKYSGLVGYNGMDDFFQFYNLSGPLSARVFSMTSNGNNLFIAPGGRDNSYVPLYYQSQMFQFDNVNWTNYFGGTIPQMYGYHDVVTIAVDPNDGKRVYAGCWGSGLLEFYNGDLVSKYGESNSTLRHHSASDTGDIRVGGACFDNEGNLWVVTSHTNSCLSMKKGDQWYGFTIPEVQESDLGQMLVDRNNQQWIVMRYGNLNPYSLLVYSDNGTPGNPAGYAVKKLNSSVGNGNIPGSIVYSMAEDLDGEIWIGTEKGVAVFYSPDLVFSGQNFDAQQILVEQGGYYQYLLENETVTAIAIDGANRKWIGTDRGGVFLFSDDGTKEIYHFTEDNSPLFSNRISSIAINQLTGEVFFGTDKGVISFKGTATEGGDTNTDVYAYPNPVKAGYSGYIAIKGLVKDAYVKITDVSGNLIYSTRAEGGQAIWDGKNLNGKKARTGVYLVIANDSGGKEKVATKILFIN